MDINLLNNLYIMNDNCVYNLQIYGWEPVRCFESFTTGWGKISDLVVTSDKVVSLSPFLAQLLQ